MYQTAKEIELQTREGQLRNRELELEREKHELQLQRSKAEVENYELRIERRKAEFKMEELNMNIDKAELQKKETELKEKIGKLEKMETEFQKNGADIIRLAISKKFRRGMEGTKEHELKQSRDINALQRCRYERYVYEQDLDEAEDRLAEFLDLETGLREIAQREICLRGQFAQDPTRLEEAFEATQKEYKRLEHEWWMIRDSFSGPLERGFELWRRNPKWYLHRVLREDCAGRGGCCGRDCGCCLERKLDWDRERAAGHCTVECGCCQNARGFDLSEDEKKKFSIRYAVSQDDERSLDLKDIRLKNLELKNLELQHVLSEEALKDTLMQYEFPDGEIAKYEQYTNEAEFTDYDSDDDDSGCPANQVEDPYYRRISQASIWGLVDGNFENPFDLIDERPTREPTWQLVAGQEENDSTMTESDY
ncbi:unnamed protein product [Penicillium egyptiacum]|uniref:Uncharacterized protein n=1 Tax=Penicillium egyptiacum TaxID=1303716 RepID=A0A9W4KII2_9EURO|nr:unnamed protein product [Penicillium egyptiacum]